MCPKWLHAGSLSLNLTASSYAIGPSKADDLRPEDALSGLHQGDVMPTLTVTIPCSLEALLKDAVVGRPSSLDSVVTAALSQYFQTAQHRAYQISASAALVQGVYGGLQQAVPKPKEPANREFNRGVTTTVKRISR